MSVRVTSAILDIDTGAPGTKLILMLLADFAREDGGSAFPSVETLSKRSCMCERSVRENLRRLLDGGFIEIEKRIHNRPTIYRVAISARVEESSRVADSSTPDWKNLPLGLADSAPNPLLTVIDPLVIVETRNKRFVKPTVHEIKLYMIERLWTDTQSNSEKFFDYYQSKGWKVGKAPMSDWHACVRTWEKNGDVKSNAFTESPPPKYKVNPDGSASEVA